MNSPFLDIKNRNVELDILRALAIVLIVVGHLTGFLEQGILTKVLSFVEIPMLFLGLALFFSVSGFSLYLNNKVMKNYHDVVRFYKKRLVRIYPLYWIAVAVILIEYQQLSFTQSAVSLTPAQALITLIGAQVLLAPRFGAEPMLWFIGAILILYLLYPLIIYYLDSNKKLFFTLSLIYIAFLSIRVLFNIIDTRFFIYYWVFIGGILACKYCRYAELLTKPQRRLILVCGGFVLVLIFLVQVAAFAVIYNKNLLLNNVVHLPAELWLNCGALFAILLTVPLFLTVQLHTKQVGRKVYSFAFLLSFSSFCIYLFHGGILDDSKYIGANVLHLSGFLLNLMIIIVGLSLVFVIAFLIQFTYNSAIERAKKTSAACFKTGDRR